MKKSKVNTGFSKYSDADLATKSEAIHEGMTNNPYFTDPVPTLAALQAAITAFTEALTNAASRDKVKVAIKNECRQVLEDLLMQLARYVNFLANGNEAMLTSTNFELGMPGDPTSLEQPGPLTISNGITTGELLVRLKKVKGAYSYMYQVTPDPMTPESIWQSESGPRSSNTFSGLVPGQKYWFRIAAVGAFSQVAYSPVANQVAQ